MQLTNNGRWAVGKRRIQLCLTNTHGRIYWWSDFSFKYKRLKTSLIEVVVFILKVLVLLVVYTNIAFDLQLCNKRAFFALEFAFRCSFNAKQQKIGIKRHKRYVWDVCCKYAE